MVYVKNTNCSERRPRVQYTYSFNNPVNYTDPSGHMATSGCDGVFEGCLSDADNWGANFVSSLLDHIDFNDPASNPQGQIFLELYNYILPLGQADGASINEIVSQALVDTVSFMKHGRDSWYPIASDADLLVKTLLFASVADASFDKASDGEEYLGHLPTRTRTRDKTHGLLVLDDEPPIPVVSGQNGPAATIPRGSRGFDAITQTHVEGHVAALMVNHGWTRATLYINNVPCPSCDRLLPRMLPPGARLNVIGPNGFQKLYVGGRW